MDHWTETIQELEERAVELEGLACKAREAAETLRVLAAERGVKIQPKERASQVGRKKNPTSPLPRFGPKSKFSQYLGVSDGKVTKGGRQRFKATVCINRKNKTLGTFYVEEEAAAAVQEAKGNKDEAQQLRELAKQKAADEDPPAEPGHVGHVWQCNKCGHQHLQTKCPERCEECGHGLLSKFV